VSSRRQERRLAIEILFQVSDHLEEIDRTIAAHSEGWTVDRMASVDRTVLRVAAYELAFGGEVPVGVAIDEAVRAAKDLSTEDSGRFVNGILGKIARELDPNQA
jgi:N utilization substance protein B